MDNQCRDVREGKAFLSPRYRKASEAPLFQIKILPRKWSSGNLRTVNFSQASTVVTERGGGLQYAECFMLDFAVHNPSKIRLL